MQQRPSVAFGFRQAVLLRRLVLAVWVVAIALQLPPLVVLGSTMAPSLSQLPANPERLATGDLLLIGFQSLEQVWEPVAGLALLCLGGWWMWTVLWHASIVSWQVWFTGRELRVGEVLGMGLAAWWRFLRLSLMTVFVMTTCLVVLWTALGQAMARCLDTGAETRYLVLLGLGGCVTLALVVVSWSAALWGAWLLGVPGSRSAVAAWAQGLVGGLRSPLTSVATLLAWVVPAMLLNLVPLVIGWQLPLLRGCGTLILGLGVELASSFCWVALFISFAPVTGLWPAEEAG